VLAAMLLNATNASAATPEAHGPDLGHTPRLALDVLSHPARPTLAVSSPAFKRSGEIPLEYTQYGKNTFPGLAWSAGPKGTRCYVILLQGESYAEGPTTIQFALFNVPAGTRALTKGMTTPPAGSIYGPNVHGANKPYAGPHTHTSDRHGYHFQVIALDSVLELPVAASFDALISAMSGHVLATGDLVAYTAKPADAVYQSNGG
jgi:para-nitrobenzyl esterase